MKPSVGRIVHVLDLGMCVAAIVTRVWDGDAVNIRVFLPNGGEENRTHVAADEWHWPERV